MRKVWLPLFFLLFVVTLAPVVYAREGESTNSGSSSSSNLLEQKKPEIRRLLEGDVKKLERMDRKEAQIMETFAKREEKLASKAAERKEKLEERREHFASRAAELEDRFKKIEAEIHTKREQEAKKLAERLAKLKDQKKAEIATRVDANLDLINRNRTAEMSKNLSRMLTILEKSQTRIASASAAGKNTASASAALAAANTAVTNAQAAVTAQAGKTYTVTFSSEDKLGQDVKAARDKLFTDLKATHTQVVDARKSVEDVVKAVVALGGVQ